MQKLSAVRQRIQTIWTQGQSLLTLTAQYPLMRLGRVFYIDCLAAPTPPTDGLMLNAVPTNDLFGQLMALKAQLDSIEPNADIDLNRLAAQLLVLEQKIQAYEDTV